MTGLVPGVHHERGTETTVVDDRTGQGDPQRGEGRRRHHHERPAIVMGAGRGLEHGDLRGEHGEVGQGFVLLATEDAAELGDRVVGVRGSAQEVVRRSVVGEGFESHASSEGRTDAFIDVVVARRGGRSVGERDEDVPGAVIEVRRGEPHEFADLLGPADAATFVVAHRPVAVAPDA